MKVVNINDPFDVYIGRNPEYGDPKFGNPFYIGKDGTRKEVIEKYRLWIRKQTYLFKDLLLLDGKVLGCHCKPKSCHGDVIVETINRLKREILLKRSLK